MKKKLNRVLFFSSLSLLFIILLALVYVLFGIDVLHSVEYDNFLLIDNYIYAVGLIFGIILALSYYFFTKDKTEAISIFLLFSIMLLTGLQDFFVYLFYGDISNVPMDWLDSSFASIIPKILDIPITLYSVLFNTFVFISLGLFISYYLIKK